MRKDFILCHKYKFITILAILLVFLVLPIFAKNFMPQKIQIGAYDPEGRLKSQRDLTWQSEYVAWTDPVEKITASIRSAHENARLPIITLEPWARSTDLVQKGDPFLIKVIGGEYDAEINTVCGAMANSGEILIRWGHEVEVVNGRYPWSGTSHAVYIDAYKHFVELCKKSSANLKFVWSPAGDPGAEQYWPGADYVDYVGISVYSYDVWELAQGHAQRSFADIAGPKLKRVAGYNKPIIVIEMGVTGSEDYKTNWLTNIKVKDLQSPNLVGMVYFNSRDVDGAWGSKDPTPDWRLKDASAQALSGLIVK